MTTTSKIVLGVLGAAAAGVAIGMLVAPEKGCDMREKIATGARDWASEFTDWLTARQKDLKDIKNTVAAHAEDVADQAGAEWNKAKNTMS
ncbi:YtxH domain-containing protein [Flavihumibacter sp. ZG627]|uniref:YtxH domain-containing protein n=1 Tax=Flavihumibacter sp. ZG627 TaxID=1463156 RepID=UPI00057E4ECA|nr:YtxH domain-containing protein [Flavihumibacter sp. ZG627]